MIILVSIIAYLIGSVSMSIIITKYILKDDVRDHGSHNAGATNVARVFGIIPGIITLICDFLKCFIAMSIGRALLSEAGFAAAGIACLTGHCFPVYFGFRGGKAVSTGICVAFLADWRIGIIALLTFLIVFMITHIVSVSSVSAAAVSAVSLLFFDFGAERYVLLVFTCILIIVMHRDNIKRLVNGEEKKFVPGKRGGKEE